MVVQSWLGAVCPLIFLEVQLREKAAAATYVGGFIEYWLHRLIYLEAPPWVFSVS